MKLGERARTPRSIGERGLALVIVLVVLLVLLVLATPFLMMARNADSASGEAADRSEALIALDTAGRHVRAVLGDGVAISDKTPYWDAKDEIDVSNTFEPGFLDANDPNGCQWDAAVEDVAGKIDLNSCPPHVIANLLGVSKRFSEAVAEDSKTLKLNSSSGLRPTGFLWANGELVQYSKIAESELVQFVRGVLGPPKGKEWRGGPRPPGEHDLGEPVLDQRAFALPSWRVATEDGRLRPFEALEELGQAGRFELEAALAKDKSEIVELDAEELRPLFACGTVHGGVCGGAVWQHATRVTTPIQGGQDGKLRVESNRWINPGSTVRITDGTNTELAIVSMVSRSGEVFLDKLLVNDYAAYRAELSVLARRPVNLNTASKDVLVALFTNLQMAGRNSRILLDEAEVLARIVIASRPLEGFEDFLRRVVLPAAGLEKMPSDAPVIPEDLAAGQAVITSDKALALYRNGLNANDGGLAFSTMPYSFTTRDTYEIQLRASVNALSGVERARRVREEVAVVAPQRELLKIWARQEDFDEELRLGSDAPWWATGPNATTRWDAGASPPSRLWAHMGTVEGQAFLPGVTDMSSFQDRESPPTPEHVFASREPTAWAQLWPYRHDEMGQRKSRVLHFDHETRDLEGRYLPDQAIRRSTDDKQLAWTDPSTANGRIPLCRPLALDMWIKPRQLDAGRYLDVGGSSRETDRISLMIEGTDLVLRVLDGPGDHPDTPFKEAAEIRYAIAKGDGPGLPADTWSHVSIDVRGNRPSQMDMRVNGTAFGVRHPGLTRLTGSLGQSVGTIAVESTEGFPDQCCIRIGNELIEVTKAGNSFDATRQETGKNAGFGGRTAREQYTSTDTTAAAEYPGTDVPAALAQINTTHASGATVELYGYSAPLASRVPTGHVPLAAELGPWRVAKVVGVQGGATPQGDPIILNGTTIGGTPVSFTLGMGAEAQTNFTALTLVGGDKPGSPAADFMKAFHTGGGYAVLVQTANLNQVRQTAAGSALAGIEIIRYSGWSGTTLTVAQRGIGVAELPTLARNTAAWLKNLFDQTVSSPRRAFVATFTGGFTQYNRAIPSSCFIAPISLAVPNATQTDYAPQDGLSHFAQVTHLDDVEKTEWVRYDDFAIAQGQLVRDDPKALRWLFNALTLRTAPPNWQPTPGGPGGGGVTPGGGGVTPGGGGGVQPGGMMLSDSSASASPSDGSSGSSSAIATLLAAPTASSAPAAQYSSNWEPRLGKTENKDFPLSDSAASRFQFRGVFGTFTHTHPAGMEILPVFQVYEHNIAGGRPGSLDAAFLVGSNSDHPGWPVRVHHVHRPSFVNKFAWWEQLDGSNDASVATSPTNPPDDSNLQEQELLPFLYVALQKASPEPMTPGNASTNAQQAVSDGREIVRLVSYPSGELPRQVSKAAIGGDNDGRGGPVPSAFVDEVIFGDARTFQVAVGAEKPCTGASMVLDGSAIDDDDLAIKVLPKATRIAIGDYGLDYEFLNELPEDAGLLRVGDEIVCYDKRDPKSGDIQLATNGRGLLGTRAQPHEAYDPVLFLEHATVSFLASGISATDALIPLASTEEFPEQGTLLIGDELVHYTRLEGTSCGMPRASSKPGKMDAQGEGLFRGRFGTTAASHAAGDAVILFPIRYWDRWAPKADASELVYFGLGIAQPAAFWTSCTFQKEDTDAAQIGVLQRTDPDAPWDGDPDQDKRLALFWDGDQAGHALLVGKQSDRIDWRVFVKYAPNAFDAKTGMSRGWRQTPRLKLFAAGYYAPSVTLRSVER